MDKTKIKNIIKEIFKEDPTLFKDMVMEILKETYGENTIGIREFLEDNI